MSSETTAENPWRLWKDSEPLPEGSKDTLTSEQAVALGLSIDKRTYPWAAYKGSLPTPSEYHLIVTPAWPEANAEIDAVEMNAEDVCGCGHAREDHIYWTGACRPGSVCSEACTGFTPLAKKRAVAYHHRAPTYHPRHSIDSNYVCQRCGRYVPAANEPGGDVDLMDFDGEGTCKPPEVVVHPSFRIDSVGVCRQCGEFLLGAGKPAPLIDTDGIGTCRHPVVRP